MKKEQNIWILLRFTMSFILLWAFFDKLFGLGFSTQPGKAWIDGVLPTTGFLQWGVHGPLAFFYNNISSSQIVAVLFMAGLFLIGLSLLLGIGVKIAGYYGALLMLLMWSALLPPKNNPFIDEHIVYALVFIGLTFVKPGHCCGLGKWWSKTKLVKKYTFLE